MASIIAVPWLQQTSSVFQEDWEKEFDDIGGTRETSFAGNDENFSASPLDTLSDSFFAKAVVVFLSVKGGLVVFTADEVGPNAYVLFFTCLVGAVFSEKICG